MLLSKNSQVKAKCLLKGWEMVFKRKRNRHKLFEENNFTDLGYSSSI